MHDMDLEKQIEIMREKRGAAYTPRTRHLDANGWAKYTNRLFLESSPYLLQHAHNPVNWYPWGDEAFETARKRKIPVLLSVGYSTCHWCHVMEEESFEDEEIAGIINDNYIAVKVDREERPDVDAVYMAAVQALTGSGGWPMTVWLTPDRKPFYGGTYFPPRDGSRGVSVGFATLLQALKKSYDTQPDVIDKSSRNLVGAVQAMLAPQVGGDVPQTDMMEKAFNVYESRFDSTFGGLSGAPKFPSSLPIRFLLRYYNRFHDRRALQMAVLTLDKMAAGGMYDHIGGGFHRYSTDRSWLVPHFEKMLYDNALLVMDYLEGYQVTGDTAYRRVAAEVLAYIQRDMTASEGAFYSATDADSLTPAGRMEEGYFFTWTDEELQQALGNDLYRIAAACYLDGPEPNFEGRTILNTPRPLQEVSRDLGMDTRTFHKSLEAVKIVLRRKRSQRPSPLRDEKILTAWNGLMISAFARAGFLLHNADYIQAAVKAAGFVQSRLYADKRLLRSFKDGQGKQPAFLEDYAFVTAGCIDLFEATHDLQWLHFALELERTLEELYADREGGAYFAVSADHEQMIAREKPNYDGAVPSGNSVAVMNLLRLGALTSRDDYRQRARKAITSFHGILKSQATALAELLLAIDFYLSHPLEIAIITPQKEQDAAKPFLDRLRKVYTPNRSLVVAGQGEDLQQKARIIPLLQGRSTVDGKTTAYVCRQNTCSRPATDPNDFERQLKGESF